MSTFLALKLGKLILFGIAAFAWGIYCGVTGRDLRGRPAQRGRQERSDDR